MKLRMMGNSVRLRLTRTEVKELAEKGLLEEVVEFSPAPLVYMIHASKECAQLEISFLNGWITVAVPPAKIVQWAAGNEVGMAGNFRGVAVLIEKDWDCLHGSEEENEDKFTRPAV